MQTIEDLVHIIRSQPNLGKEASSTLLGLGEAVSVTATAGEIAALLHGTLSQESYVRNSCLQTIQVHFFNKNPSDRYLTVQQPFDLTDMDWSPELWIACHDDDEQNARLARHAWEDNGLDVPEKFLDSLLNFLGEFVRCQIFVY